MKLVSRNENGIDLSTFLTATMYITGIVFLKRFARIVKYKYGDVCHRFVRNEFSTYSRCTSYVGAYGCYNCDYDPEYSCPECGNMVPVKKQICSAYCAYKGYDVFKYD